MDGEYAAPEPLEGLNTELDDSNQYIAPDQGYLLFASDRAGGGVSRFYVSYQRDGRWSPPEALPDMIHGAASVLTPVVTPDGKRLELAGLGLKPR